MGTSQDLKKPHKCRTATCKGVLLEPIENYGTWAYWHSEGHQTGWHSKPLTEQPQKVGVSPSLVPKGDVKHSEATIILAQLILASCTLNQESYDHKAADAATEANDKAKELETNESIRYLYCVDYSKFYKYPLREACEKACADAGHPEMATPVFLMVDSWWNDANDWANEILGNPPHRHVHDDQIDGPALVDEVVG